MRNHATLFRPLDAGYQTVSTSTTSAATTNGVGAQTYQVAIFADVATHIRFGKSPTALATDFLLPATTLVFFPIAPGEKVAAILDSGTGSLYVSEMTT